MKNRITFAALASLAVPTLLITGDADLYTPPPVLRLFAARIKGSAMTLLPKQATPPIGNSRNASTLPCSTSCGSTERA